MFVPLSAPVVRLLRTPGEVLPSLGAAGAEGEAFIHNMMSPKCLECSVNIPHNARVSPAGVCKASRHVHGVCRAVA